jgi:hypothetical protein
MANTERDATVAVLKEKLAELERVFDIEVRRRGFDPAQVENMALPAPLARLFEECAALRAKLEDLAID